MLLRCRKHDQFRWFLKKWMPLLWAADPSRLRPFEKALTKVWLLNINPAIPLFLEHSSPAGRPMEFDPVDLLRSLVLMADQKVFSITKWVELLRSDRVLAVLSGFEPRKTPGVGTFYDFLDKYWLEDQSVQITRRKRLRSFKRKPRKKLKAGEKFQPKHPGIVEKLVQQVFKTVNLSTAAPKG